MNFPKKKIIISLIISIFSILALVGNSASATEQFLIEPPEQSIFLSPGETYIGTFIITNPESNTSEFEYGLTITNPTKYLSIEETSGTVFPYSSKEVLFTITIPEEATPGGQYITITVSPKNKEAFAAKDSLDSHEIYLEVAGEAETNINIISSSVPGFLTSGKISGNTIIENNGKNHSNAFYTLEVTPLFSGTPIYTNTDSPVMKTVLPGGKVESGAKWEDAPSIGLYNVSYTVRIGDQVSETKQLVILCPVWMIILILVIIALAVLYAVYLKKRKDGTIKTSISTVVKKLFAQSKQSLEKVKTKLTPKKQPAVRTRRAIQEKTEHMPARRIEQSPEHTVVPTVNKTEIPEAKSQKPQPENLATATNVPEAPKPSKPRPEKPVSSQQPTLRRPTQSGHTMHQTMPVFGKASTRSSETSSTKKPPFNKTIQYTMHQTMPVFGKASTSSSETSSTKKPLKR